MKNNIVAFKFLLYEIFQQKGVINLIQWYLRKGHSI